MDTAEHPIWGLDGPKGNVNFFKLDVNFFHLMILIARFSFYAVFGYSGFMNCLKVKLI